MPIRVGCCLRYHSPRAMMPLLLSAARAAIFQYAMLLLLPRRLIYAVLFDAFISIIAISPAPLFISLRRVAFAPRHDAAAFLSPAYLMLMMPSLRFFARRQLFAGISLPPMSSSPYALLMLMLPPRRLLCSATPPAAADAMLLLMLLCCCCHADFLPPLTRCCLLPFTLIFADAAIFH